MTALNCTIPEMYAKSKLLSAVLFLQIFFSALTIILLFLNLPFPCKKQAKIKIHWNLKIILINAVILYLLHAICLLIAPLKSEIEFFTYTDPCDLFIITWKCLLMRIPINLAKVGFTLLHLVIFLERGLATLLPAKYENMSKLIGIFATILMWTIIIGWNTYIFWDEKWIEYKPYCVMTSNQNNDKLKILHYILLGLDILVTVADILLTLINKKQLTARFKRVIDNNYLSRSYQLEENKRTMRIILPMSVIHACFFTFFLASSLTVRELYTQMDEMLYKSLIEVTNVITCVYTVVVPLVFLRLRKKLQKCTVTKVVPLEEEAQVYHRHLSNLWNK